MEITTRYITKEDFKEYFGIDLDIVLRDDANPSNKSTAFLMRIEDRMAAFIDGNFNRNIDLEYKRFTDFQKLCYQKALLEQAIYIFRNGDISVDSGYDGDKGVLASQSQLKSISIAPNAKAELMRCGIWNRNISSYRGFKFWGSLFK